MPTGILVPLIFAAALGSGLMAGTFFAFSVFVMGALGRLPPEHGIAAMQSINIVVINRAFLAVFAGTAVISAALALTAVLGWRADGADWILTGSLLYIVGCFVVTMVFNVPLNDRLAGVAASTGEAHEVWRIYLVQWTNWNHVRTVAPLVALGCFLMALRAIR